MAVDPLPGNILTPLFIAVAIVFLGLFFILATPRGLKPWPLGMAFARIRDEMVRERAVTLVALATLAGHLIQVNFIGPRARAFWQEATGVDFAGILYAIEGDFVPMMADLHWWPLLFVTYWFYLVFHNALVLAAPFFLAYTHERVAMRRLLISYPIVWVIAQIGFFFFPADNPTIYLGLDSQLDHVLPGTEAVFYKGTTISNTVPSLHVALATLIMLHGLGTRNRRYRLAVIVYAPLVAFSIVYLQIHWALDAVAGAIAASIAYVASVAIERRMAARSARPATETG